MEKLEQLATQYFLVCKCWHNHREAVRNRMSVERAIKILREVREGALKYHTGRLLGRRALSLLQDIVRRQEEPQEMIG